MPDGQTAGGAASVVATGLAMIFHFQLGLLMIQIIL